MRIDSSTRAMRTGERGLPHQRRGLRDSVGDRGHLRAALRGPYLLPVIKAVLEGFRFTISGFYAPKAR